MNYREDSNC